ncbi:efflux RND transporter periplasmic adaptor subunit [Sandaracinobacteroides saxicola]|nr:efflux RND transporter periplasmic adaptor subunit [Sandaracinobacteroides saxicola]
MFVVMLAACGQPDAPPPFKLPVDAAKPVIRTVQDWDEYAGRFEAINFVEVRARVSGQLERIAYRDGDTVKAGDLLFVIDQRPFRVAVAQAEARVADTTAQLAFARTELGRAEELFPKGFIPGRTLDQRRQELVSATAAVTSARAALADARLNLSFTEVRAPVGGRTSARTVSIGNLVTGGGAGGTLLTTIASLNPIRFVFDADEAAYLKYTRMAAAGDRPSSRDAANPVRLRLDGEEGWPHRGRMDFVDNRIDPQSGTMRGRAVFDNPGAIFVPGMFGRMQLLGSGEYRAVLLPETAIGSDQTAKVVFVVGSDGAINPRPVTLGPLIDGLRVIRTGLKGDETVVINGLVRLRPGLQVQPKMTTIQAEMAATRVPGKTAS